MTEGVLRMTEGGSTAEGVLRTGEGFRMVRFRGGIAQGRRDTRECG